MADYPISVAQFEQLQRENLYAFLMVYLRHILPNREIRRTKHIEAMCFALEAAGRGEIKRLIISVPPRHLKSVTVAVAFVAWMLGRDPSKQVMVASYGADLALAHARGFRTVIRQPSFQRLFPAFRVAADRDTVDETVTTQNGHRMAISVGGKATGFGADLIICDDLLKASDAGSELVRSRANAYFDETLYSRLNIKSEGVIIVIQQRLHEDDLVGHLLEQGGWHHINMPSIASCNESIPLYGGRSFDRKKGDLLAPHLESAAVLEEHRRRMGPVAFNAQYLLDPTPPDGHRLDWNWFGSYDQPLPRDDYSYIVQSWDTATSDDPDAAFSVCLTFGYDQGAWELLDVFRERLNYPPLRRAAIRLFERWSPDRVIVEDASSGRQLAQDLREQLSTRRRAIVPFHPICNKEERFDLQLTKIEDGLVCLPEDAPWLPAFKNELRRFPLSTFKDQVDALSQFLEWTSSTQARTIGLRDPQTGRRAKTPRPHGMRLPSMWR